MVVWCGRFGVQGSELGYEEVRCNAAGGAVFTQLAGGSRGHTGLGVGMHAVRRPQENAGQGVCTRGAGDAGGVGAPT